MDNIKFSYTSTKEKEEQISFQTRLLESVNDSIVVAELNGEISFWNKGSERLFGWTSEETIGKPFSILFEGNDITDIPTQFNEIHSGFWEGIIKILTKSKQEKYTRVSVTAMYNQFNKPTNLVGVFNDITELIESRVKAEEALRSKSEFLANVSHEIRTPMTGILAYTELLENLPMSDKQKNYLQNIKTNADQLLDLINDILDLSKIEADKMLVDKNSFNLQNSLQSIVKIFKPTINSKKLQLNLTISPDLPPEIISDNSRIKQIISNLLSNAVKFTEHGHIGINIYRGKTIDDEKFQLVTEITDTGIGISPDKIPILYEPFVQVDSSTTRKYGGTGLGLAISKKLVEMLDGEIQVESQVGKGSKFMFTIPVSEVMPTTRTYLETGDDTEDKLHKLLLISPSDNLFREISDYLANSEIELIWAQNNKRIPSIISFYEPDIIVLDSMNNLYDKDLQLVSLKKTPPLFRLYNLTNSSDLDPPLFIDQPNMKTINSLEALISDLNSISIEKDTITTSSDLIKVLLIDENKISRMLLNNILSNQNYIVESYPIPPRPAVNNQNRLSFDIILIDIDIINKYSNEFYSYLNSINYKSLIGIGNHTDHTGQNIFTDFIYKPVTASVLLDKIVKHRTRESESNE
ncbi:MAG TPA: ATP-binding protein [Syntrophomonadaceae bacterium]|nr:ATP-binding protein [Syntrophomonadaceae bacterium]